MQSKTKALIVLIVVLIAAGAVWSIFRIDRIERVNVSQVANDPCPIPTPSLEIKPSEDVGTQIVVLGGDGVGQITVVDPAQESDSHILVKRPCHAWITASATGRGGYILYGGEDQLYKLVYADKKLTRVNFDGFMTDLSSDETRVASVSTVDGVSGSQVVIVVTNTDGSGRIQYEVPTTFNDAGSAKFSPDGTKIAYAAVERDENGDPVKRAVFVIDLNTGEQTLSAREDMAAGLAPYVQGWSNNTTPIVTDQP